MAGAKAPAVFFGAWPAARAQEGQLRKGQALECLLLLVFATIFRRLCAAFSVGHSCQGS